MHSINISCTPLESSVLCMSYIPKGMNDNQYVKAASSLNTKKTGNQLRKYFYCKLFIELDIRKIN